MCRSKPSVRPGDDDLLQPFVVLHLFEPGRDSNIRSDEVVNVEGIVEFEASLTKIDDALQRAMDPNVVKRILKLDS